MKKIVLYVDFPHQAPFGDEMSNAMADLAQSIIEEPGCLWKIWTENEKNKEAGGIYLFEDRASAEKYLKKHSERLENWGYNQIRSRIFEINESLSAICNAPL